MSGLIERPGAGRGALTIFLVLAGCTAAAIAPSVARTRLRQIVFSTQALDFGLEPEGSISDPIVVTLTSAGRRKVRIRRIVTDGDYHQINDCPASLDPGQSCRVEVSFAPSGSGRRDGTLLVRHDSHRDPRRLALQGMGGTGPLAVDFERIEIDHDPPASVLEKALADLDGDGRLDAVIGFGYPSSGGIVWYRNPPSGDPHDPWMRATIVPSGSAYEDMLAADMNGDGVVDIVASHELKVKWFENPRGSGNDPSAQPWRQHVVGSGAGENNLVLADLDGDGTSDLATNAFVYFRDGADAWTTRSYGRAGNGVSLLDVGSGAGALNLVGTPLSSPGAIAWFENPRERGGDPRTDPWDVHLIGPGYGSDTALAFATGDLNGDRRMDVVTARSEGDEVPPVGELVWWEAPVERADGAWIGHVIDPLYTSAHNIRLADIDGNGALDIVTAEQEQSPLDRVSVFLNDGRGSFTEIVLANGSGHNLAVGDLEGDGDIDILNAGHGFYGAPHPVEIFVNRK